MKKILVSLIVSLLLFFGICRSANAYVQYSFIGPLYRGTDNFYGTSVVAYKAGTNATLTVSVYNDYYGKPINVSAVKIGFDWGKNYTSTDVSETSPVQIKPYQTLVFNIFFVVPKMFLTKQRTDIQYM